MSAPDQTREPCPDRILDDIGGAFGMGAVGGSVFHFVKGMKNSPNGERLLGGAQAIRMNAPRIGGSFAVWGGLFSVFDCSMVYVRQKEDPWNSIFAGAATGGFLQTRHGVKAASRAALFGGVLLALIEGAGLMINRVLANMAQLPPPPIDQPTGLPAGVFLPGQIPPNSPPPSPPPSSAEPDSSWTSWMGGIFAGKHHEEASAPSSSSSSSSEVLSASSNPSSAESGWASFGKGLFGGKKEEPSASSGETLASFETSSGPAMPTFDYK